MEGRLILLAFMVFVTPGTAQMNITETGCGSTKLCVGCDPATNQTCLFASVANVSMTSNVTTLSFKLKGWSTGYIKLMLQGKPPVNVSVDFTCGHNTSANGSFSFTSFPPTVLVTNLQGSVAGDAIQCTFNVTIIISNLSNINVFDLFNITLSRVPPDSTTAATTPSGTMATANGTMMASTTANGTMTTANGTMTTANGTTGSNTTTIMTTLTTKKPTGASVALHPYAYLLFLSLVMLFVLQKV